MNISQRTDVNTSSSSSRDRKILLLEILVVVLITSVAAVLRFYQIEQVPPGLNSDEAVGAVGAVETLRNGLRLQYAGQGASGALGFYIEALAFALFGPSVASARGATAFAGVVSVLATYLFTREIFRTKFPGEHDSHQRLNRARLLAALAAFGLATSLWNTQASRVAFAAIAVPFLQIPSNFFLWRGLNTGRWIHFAISGVLLSAVAGIYMSGAFAPLIYVAFFLLQWAIALVPGKNPQPVLVRQHFRNLVICAGVAFLFFLPMLYFYLSAPEMATSRAQQTIFTNPLINKGDPIGTLWRSIWGNFEAFGLSTSWFGGRAPGNLILPVPASLLFLLGFAISLWRIRRPAYLFLLLSWAVMLVPSILTPDSIPHPLRALGASPFAYIVVAIGMLAVVDLVLLVPDLILKVMGGKSGGESSLSFRECPWARIGVTAGVLLILFVLIGRPLYKGFYNYMVVWPKTNDAQAAFHVYAVELAEDMSEEHDPEATFLLPRDTAAGDINPNYTVMFFYKGQAGYAWVVDDEETLETTLDEAVAGRNVVHVIRWKTSKHTGADPKDIIPYYLEKHGKFLESRSFEYYDIETFQLDEQGPTLADPPLASSSLDFGDVISLRGYAFGDASRTQLATTQAVPAGELMWARLQLELLNPVQEDLKVSVMVTDANGHVVGQIDKTLFNNILHQGTNQWAPGTETDAYFLVPISAGTAPGEYQVQMAVYGSDSQTRLPGASGNTNRVEDLGTVEVHPDLVPPEPGAIAVTAPQDQPGLENLTLLGFTAFAGELRPGQEVTLGLVWQVDGPVSEDYQASLTAAPLPSDTTETGDGQMWPIGPQLPLAGIDYPTSDWSTGQVVRGWFDGRIPPDTPNGDYQLWVQITDSSGEKMDEFLLGQARVEGWPRQFELPSVQHPVEANFGHQVELLGYDIGPYDSQTGSVEVVVYWRALTKMDRDYTSFVHILDQTGQVVSQVDHTPGDGEFPTTGWLQGEVIADGFSLPLPLDKANAADLAEIGLYDSLTLERLPVLDQSGQTIDTRVLLPLTPGGEQD